MAWEAQLVRRSALDVIAYSLRIEILRGDLPGGTQLKQNDVAARFDASVAPVREAFQRLVAEGLATHQPHRGVTVTAMTSADVTEIAEIRELLEPHVLRLSAKSLTAADLDASEAILRRAATTGNLEERARLHWDFHSSLYRRANRPRIIEQLGNLYTGLNRGLLPTWSRVGLSPDWMGSHLDILTALRNGDIDAACRTVLEQIKSAAARVLNQPPDAKTPFIDSDGQLQ